MDAPRASLANIPSVDRLLRQAALAGTLDALCLSDEQIGSRLRTKLEADTAPALRPVFNLTGTVLHTNLGRAVLPEEAVAAVLQSMRAPVNLEYDLATGRRGERDTLVEKLLCELTGAHTVSVSELAELGRARSVPVAADLGSGSLVDMTRWNLPKEPTVQETVAVGAALVSFSGDKLLGGPQAGLVVGRADLIAKLRKHPLKRALRVGKLTLAALEPVLALYRNPESLAEHLTTLKLLTRSASEIQAQAVRLRSVVQTAIGDAYAVTDASVVSQIGSGALPVDTLPSHGLAIRVIKGKRGSLDRLESLLRGLPRPVIGRVSDKTLWLDMRCLSSADEAAFVDQWGKLAP